MATDNPTDEDREMEPGSAGVVGEQPNRFAPGGFQPLDEAPEGDTPSDVTDSSDDSLPPGAPAA